MEPKTRKFRVGDGRTLFLPSALTEGTHNMRVNPGDIVELDVDRIVGRRGQPGFRRYVNNLVRMGDLVEVTAPASPSPAAMPARKE